MAGHQTEERPVSQGDVNLPPGTFQLFSDDLYETEGRRAVILSPIPSNDPNEPLNWSPVRKIVNFTLVLAVTCLIFTALTIQTIFWQQMTDDMGVTYTQLNNATSVNYVGLAMGCVLFIPFANKYGRRPVYLASTAVMMATSFWSGEMTSLAELYITNLLQGLAGATNEAIVQITISDLFFVHHRGAMNALYMSMVMSGSFLTPMAAGAQATSERWRWSYRTLGIVNTIIFILFIFFYEETKYNRVIEGLGVPDEILESREEIQPDSLKKDCKPGSKAPVSAHEPSTQGHELDHSIAMKSWRERLSLVTYTSGPIWPFYYRPFEALLIFPAVLFTALQYGASIAWLTITVNVLSLVFPLPPYNFSSAQVGYMSVGPFIGNLIGVIYGGFLGDRSVLYFSRRNKGYYEPEMRLYILPLPVLAMCGGLIMFGVTVSKGMHWILPSVAGAIFAFGLGSIGDASLTFVIDSYRDITGDSFTSIAFVRNAISVGIPFAITPWMQRNGLSNMFIACGFISLAIGSMFIPMIIYGKKIRARLANRYQRFSAKQWI